jgi:hypothetical protein
VPDFNPIDEAKHIMRDEGGIIPFSGDRRIPVLVDYITALRGALELARPYVDKIADEWDDQNADTLLHTIRHLLDD